MKRHLKRLASPKTWKINRKEGKFIMKPRPGPHPLKNSLPLGVVIRDFLGYAKTAREAKKLLNNQEVLVDGQRRKDHLFPIGLFDVLSFPLIKKNFRVLLDRKGRIALKEISEEESQIKPCKIIGKTILPKNKIQLNLFDGKNILTNKKVKVGDTVLISLPHQEIKEILELKEGVFVFLTKGKHAGDFGILQEIKDKQAIYKKGEEKKVTLKEYLFVLGTKKAVISLE